jgi:phytoene dehydrogenase-like protein
MKGSNFDVIIIGSGMGGVIAGAILAKKERMKVLVLEKMPVIGGRVISFGKQYGTDTSPDQFKRLLYQGAYSYVLDCYPDMDNIITKKKIFNDYIIDGGWHAMSAADRCRYALIARSLGRNFKVAPVIGMAFWNEGRWMQMPELVKGWPKDSARERERVAYERTLISNEQAEEFDNISLKMYMESITQDKLVHDYYYMLARWQYGVNDPARLSAGEWIKCNNSTVAVGKHLIAGGGMGEVVGGFQAIATTFADIITENGGEVRANSTVKEVIIKDWKAVGVVVEGKDGSEQINAPYIVSDVPAYDIYKIIDKAYFPKELQQRIDTFYPLGALLGNICLKEPLETNLPKGQWLVDLPGVEDLGLFGGKACFGFEQTSIVDPTRAPADRCVIQIALILSRKDPDEVRNKPLMDRLGSEIMKLFRNIYPKFDSILDWYFLTTCEMAYGIENAPGLVYDRRMPQQHPAIRNLFFTGDTAKHWDAGSNGAAHSAVLCASAVTGRDYLTLLPPYWR